MDQREAKNAVVALIGEDGIAAAHAPIEEASGLPNAAYVSDDWLTLERDRIFARTWIFVAAEAEFDAIGVQKPVEVAGAPVVLVRSATGINAFHNVCRHRGAQLVDAPCEKSTVTCPYHQWTYGLDGDLRSRPHFGGPGVNSRFDGNAGPSLDLVPVRCAVWNGCVFVNLDGSAEPVETWIAPFVDIAGEYDFTTVRWAGKIDFEVDANWKFVFENYMEGYHVFSLHPALLKHAPMNTRWSGEWVQSVFHNGYIAPKLTPGRGDELPHYPGLTDEQTRAGRWFLIFPTFGAEVFADQFCVLTAHPVAPDRTREEIHIFLIGDEAATGDRYREAREGIFAMWDALNREDLDAVERLQKGRRSSAYDGGRLSPHWEGPTHQLGAHVVDVILR